MSLLFRWPPILCQIRNTNLCTLKSLDRCMMKYRYKWNKTIHAYWVFSECTMINVYFNIKVYLLNMLYESHLKKPSTSSYFNSRQVLTGITSRDVLITSSWHLSSSSKIWNQYVLSVAKFLTQRNSIFSIKAMKLHVENMMFWILSFESH